MKITKITGIGDAIIRGINVNTEIAVKNDQIIRAFKYLKYCHKSNDMVLIKHYQDITRKVQHEYSCFLKWIDENGYSDHPKLIPGIKAYNSINNIYNSIT